MNNKICGAYAECIVFNENTCGYNEIVEKKCGGPVKKLTQLKFFFGNCKICGKKIEVCIVNQWITACKKCYEFSILPRR